MLAILQVADQGPLESLVVMLRAVGIECATCSPELQKELRGIGCDTVLDHRDLTRQLGYDTPFPLPEAGIADMSRTDVLYVDVKAHRNHPKVVQRWPNLDKRILWYRINGGKPEHVINARGDFGDEVNPPCPVLTPNQWYRDETVIPRQDLTYCCWPPFYRWNDYKREGCGKMPVGFVHGNWGYSQLFDSMKDLGVLLFGQGQPNGIVSHAMVSTYLSHALAYVHLKSSDAPGYSLYEALASACPVICSRRLIWKCRMEELFIPGETCLVFDREGHQGLSDEDVKSCTEEIRGHLDALRDPAYNRKIGEAGRARLLELMWSKDRSADVTSLQDFLSRNFR